jgi:hypothetical protein
MQFRHLHVLFSRPLDAARLVSVDGPRNPVCVAAIVSSAVQK